MLIIDDKLSIPDAELVFTAIRAPGPGGQHVNKVSSAVELRFDIAQSSTLDEEVKQRLLVLNDRRISKSGVVVIKSRRSRSQDKNKADALRRLKDFVVKGTATAKPRKKTRLPRAAREKRLEEKSRRSRLKQLRKPPHS